MQNHEEYLKLASSYLDGELIGKQLEDYMHHLKGCEICRQEMEILESYQGEMRDAGKTRISPEVDSAVMKAAQKAQEGIGFFEQIFGSFNFKLNLAVSTAAIIIGLFAGILFFKFSQGF